MSTALIPQSSDIVLAADSDRYMPVMGLDAAKQRYNAIVEFTRSCMTADKDYGAIPGTSDKPVLLKAGAEKLMTFFGLTVEDPDILSSVEDWTGVDHGGEPFFYYQIRQRVTRNGKLIASQIASTNSWETKYRYRWAKEADVPPHLDKSRLPTRDGSIAEPVFAVTKAETSGPYGKPIEYWQRFRESIERGEARQEERKTKAGKPMQVWVIGAPLYRIPNDAIFDQVNTLVKMCEKRALVAAALIATNASEFFTQDLDEMPLIDMPVGHEFPPVKPTHAPQTGGTPEGEPSVKQPTAAAKTAELAKQVQQQDPQGQHGTGVAGPAKPKAKTWDEILAYTIGKIDAARKTEDAMEGQALLTKVKAGLPAFKFPPAMQQQVERAVADAEHAFSVGDAFDESNAPAEEPPSDIYLQSLEMLLRECTTIPRLDEIEHRWGEDKENVSTDVYNRGLEMIGMAQPRMIP